MPSQIIPSQTLDPVERIIDPAGSAAAPQGQVRIEEVARLAGVSIITVSRALRKPEIVSEKARAKVAEAVRATGFSLNPHASALRTGRSNVVVVFLSSTASQQFLKAADAFAQVVEAEGFEVVLARTSYSYEREIQLTQSLTQVRPAGVFITGVLEQELHRKMFRRLGIPTVESWAFTDTPIDMLVGMSNTDATIAMTRYLVERGHRRIAFVGRATGRGRIRHIAFQQECARLGAEHAGSILLPTVRSLDDGRSAFGQLMQMGKPDAVFCANDLLASGALIEARSRGMRIPEDIAIAGFGDNDLMRELDPGITTVTADSAQAGRLAGRMLTERLAGDGPSQPQIALPMMLIRRGSA